MLVMEELYTPEDLAMMLKISEYKVRAMLRKGTIKGIKIDGQWRVRPSEYQRYLNSLSEQATEDNK
jgi:excisionase family DNA binding protein